MALRNHSLDDKITTSALEEFSEKGYMGASLRKIAEKAGVTVGAIQTRYKSKDELFACLLKPFFDEIAALFQNTRADYDAGVDADLLTGLKASMRHESEAILHLIFDHYEEAFCFSAAARGAAWSITLTGLFRTRSKRVLRFFTERASQA